MNNSQNFGNEKTANLVSLIEYVQPIISDELITEIAETIASLFKINGETSFLLGAVGEEMQGIAYRYDSPFIDGQTSTAEQFVSRLKTAASLSAKNIQCS